VTALLAIAGGFAGLLAGIAYGFAALLALIALFGWMGFRPAPSGEAAQATTSAAPPGRWDWMLPAGGLRHGPLARSARWLCGLTVTVLLFAAALLAAIETVGFPLAIRFAADQVERTGGMVIAFDGVSGSLLGGRLAAEGVLVQRSDPDGGRIDLRFDRVEMDAGVSVLDPFTRRLDRVLLSDGDGTLADSRSTLAATPHPVGDPACWPSATTSPAHGDPGGQPTSPSQAGIQSLSIARLQLTNLALLLRFGPDRNDIVGLDIEQWVVDGFDGRFPTGTLLFNANGRGKISGGAFEVTAEPGSEPLSLWTFDAIPARAAGLLTGGLPRLFQGGRLSGSVSHRFDTDGSETYVADSEWSLTARGLRLSMPTDAADPAAGHAGAAAVVGFMNRLADDSPISFWTLLSWSRMEGAMALRDTGLGTAVTAGMLRRLAKVLDLPGCGG